MNYKYVKDDFLVDKKLYHYSALNGLEFIEAWRSSRQKYIISDFGSLADLSSVVKVIKSNKTIKPIDTVLAQTILNYIDRPNAINQDIEMVCEWLKIFENKLFLPDNPENWRHARLKDQDIALTRYLLLGCVFEMTYSNTSALPFLNGLLKLLDLILSHFSCPAGVDEYCISWLIRKEAEHVDQLFEVVS